MKYFYVLVLLFPALGFGKSSREELSPDISILDACYVAAITFAESFPNETLREGQNYKISDFIITNAVYTNSFLSKSYNERFWFVVFTHPKYTSNMVVYRVESYKEIELISILE
ncbi:MAG: hypothetical protein ACFE0O_15800 [Opitutales bacterium]